WIGLCPDNDIGGGKKLSVGTRKGNCRAATPLRMAAQFTTSQEIDDRRFAADRLRYQKRQKIKIRAKAQGSQLVPFAPAGGVPQKRGQGARRSKIGLRHEACSEAAKGRGVLPVQTRRQRVKDAAVDSALIAENIVE